MDNDFVDASTPEIPQTVLAVRIDDGDVEQGLQFVSERLEGKRQTAGLWMQQVAIRRLLFFVLFY